MTAKATTHVVAPMSSHSHQSCNRPDSMPRKVEAWREAFGRSKGVLEFAVPFLPSDSLEASIIEVGYSQAGEISYHEQGRVLLPYLKVVLKICSRPPSPVLVSPARQAFEPPGKVPGNFVSSVQYSHFSVKSIPMIP